MNLEIWDWRYKIGLFPDTFVKVNEYAKLQNKKKKNIYDFLIDYFSKFVSLDVILDEIMSNNINSFYDYKTYPFEIIKEKILYIPDLLKDYYFEKCNQCIDKNPKLKDYILELYNLACSKEPIKTDLKSLYKFLYKDDFKEISNNIYEVKKPDYTKTSEKIPPEDIENVFEKTFLETTANKSIIDKFGKFEYGLNDFDIQIKNNVGFAEWWNKELIKSDRDLLILYKNHDSLNLDDFIHTFYHEVYPGHGHFYNNLRKGDFSNHDYGNFELIEGWATYCEWNTVESGYAKLLKYRAAEFLKNSFADIGEIIKIESLYKNKLKNGYSKKEAINSILYFSQYSGFIESYYLGSFFIELK